MQSKGGSIVDGREYQTAVSCRLSSNSTELQGASKAVLQASSQVLNPAELTYGSWVMKAVATCPCEHVSVAEADLRLKELMALFDGTSPA